MLNPNEYDAYYFDGKNQTYTHNAGYSNYSEVQYPVYSDEFVPLAESTGTYFGDLMKSMNIRLNARFVGRRVLVVGCAYGFEVEELRKLGIDAWGIDVSAFAISQAAPTVAPYLSHGDVKVVLPTYTRNSWDYIYSRWFLECMTDADLTLLITEMNRVSQRGQIHIINTFLDPVYYNVKTLAEWLALPWAKGTVLINNNDFANYQVK